MNRLDFLRRQIVSLRRSRRFVRWGTAWPPLLTAALALLLLAFAVDVAFRPGWLERAILAAPALVSCAVVLAVTYFFFTRPFLGRRESLLDVALLVERTHRIDSDLVAALQFESPAAAGWGSPQLQRAVVGQVAEAGGTLDVFEGFSKARMLRRLAALAVVLAVAAIAFLVSPENAFIFVNRLALGAAHYPTATELDRVQVGRRIVLEGREYRMYLRPMRPKASRAAEGRPVSFSVLCGGELPPSGSVRLTSAQSGARYRVEVELRRLTHDERKGRLLEARSLIEPAVAGGSPLPPSATHEVIALAALDAPEAAALLAAGEQGANADAPLGKVLQTLNQAIDALDEDARGTAVYSGRLEELVTPLDYTIHLGDAWTEPGRIEMIPLPVVEPRLLPTPPDYAKAAPQPPQDEAARQISVLEGSTVGVEITSANDKPLAAASIVFESGETFPMRPVGGDRLRWTLPHQDTPLAPITAEQKFQIQAVDEDGLSPAAPVECQVRIKPDRPPSGSASLVSRVVVPTARPTITYRGVNDDYGISRILLQTRVERGDTEGDSSNNVDTIPVELRVEAGVAAVQVVTLAPETGSVTAAVEEIVSGPVTAERLPLAGTHELDLSKLNLRKGDRVEVVMEVVDYRGQTPGRSHFAEPVLLEVSDDNGVITAVLAPDEEAERQLKEIENELLETGEKP